MAKKGLRDRHGTIAPVYPPYYNRVNRNTGGNIRQGKHTPPDFYTDYTPTWNNGEWFLLRVLTYTNGRQAKGYEFKRYDTAGVTRLISADTLTAAIQQL